MNTCIYVCKYLSPRAVCSISSHMAACTHMHAHARAARKTHPSHMLTSLLPQDGITPLHLASTDEVKAAFVEHREHAVITDDNKNALLLDCARFGLVSRLHAVLEAGANAAHADEVRVRA